MSLIRPLQSLTPPWAHLLLLKQGQGLDLLSQPPTGFLFKVIDGRKCRTKAALLTEFARVLEFPSYFGGNWDAFEECLTDLEWLPATGYLLVVTDAESLLQHHESDYGTFIDILQATGKEWATAQSGERARPGVPFHVILTVHKGQKAARTNWRVPLLKR